MKTKTLQTGAERYKPKSLVFQIGEKNQGYYTHCKITRIDNRTRKRNSCCLTPSQCYFHKITQTLISRF